MEDEQDTYINHDLTKNNKPKIVKINIPNYLVPHEAIVKHHYDIILKSLKDLCCDEYFDYLKSIHKNFLKKSYFEMITQCTETNSILCFDYLMSLDFPDIDSKHKESYDSYICHASSFNNVEIIEHIFSKYILKDNIYSYGDLTIIKNLSLNCLIVSLNKKNTKIFKVLYYYLKPKIDYDSTNYLITIFKNLYFDNNLKICDFLLEYVPKILNKQYISVLLGFDSIPNNKYYDNIDTYQWLYSLSKSNGNLDEIDFEKLYFKKIIISHYIGTNIKKFISIQYPHITINKIIEFNEPDLLKNPLVNAFEKIIKYPINRNIYSCEKILFDLFKYYYEIIKELKIKINIKKYYNDIINIDGYNKKFAENILYILINDGLIKENYKDIGYDYYMIKNKLNTKNKLNNFLITYCDIDL